MKRLLIGILLSTSLFGCILLRGGKENILYIGAIPDQNPERLNRMYNILADELSNKLKIKVKYLPVTNYAATVSAFKAGSLDLVWFGGLTGVQARLQKQGARVIAQRDIDSKFHSVFIANKKSKINSINSIEELTKLKGKRFTFGSESSTSGRLMPQHFLEEAGVKISDFKGGLPGFSGSHDATIFLVQSGSYEAGVLNEQVWKANLSRGRVNTSILKVIWRTPSYYNYHWLVQPNIDKRFGDGFTEKIQSTLLNLDKSTPNQKKILELFGAEKFIPSYNKNYIDIEKIGRKIGKIR